MNRALVDRLLSLILVECKRAFIALTVNPKMSFLPVFEWFYDQHGVAMEEEIIENTAKLLNSWASNEGVEKLIDRFDKDKGVFLAQKWPQTRA